MKNYDEIFEKDMTFYNCKSNKKASLQFYIQCILYALSIFIFCPKNS